MTPYIITAITAAIVAICIILSLYAGRRKNVKGIKLPVTETFFPVSAGITEPVFYEKLKGEYQGQRVEVTGVKWVCDNYENKAGKYEFRCVPPRGYKLNLPPVTVNVTEDELVEMGESINIDKVAVSKATPSSFSIYDLTGCNVINKVVFTRNPVFLGENVRIIDGFIYDCRIQSDRKISAGTFGFLRMADGVSLTVTGKTDIYTLIAEGGGSLDMTEQKGHIDTVEYDGKSPLEIKLRAASQASRFAIRGDNLKYIIDGQDYRRILVAAQCDTQHVFVKAGTDIKDIPLPSTVNADFADASECVETNWQCPEYTADTGIYTFIPQINGVCIMDHADIPQIKVIATDEGEIAAEITNLPDETVIPVGAKSDSVFDADITCQFGEEVFDLTVKGVKLIEKDGGVVSDISSFDPCLAVKPAEMTVRKVETEPVCDGNVYTFDSLKVKIDAAADRKIKITDISGICTYFDNVDRIEKIVLEGASPEIVIDTPYADIGELEIKNFSGTAAANVYGTYVSKIRYSSADAENIVINGVSAQDYLDIQPLQIKNTFFANGIPTVIRQDDDGETYAYRANDLEKMSTAITCGAAFGGSYKDGVENTYIAFESGVLNDFVGGGEKGNVYGECVSELCGGFVNNDWFGACISSDYCERAITSFTKGCVKRKWYGGGADSGVGMPGHNYADNEYSVRMFFFDGIFTNITYGSNSSCGKDIYGNVCFEMFDGVGLYYSCGSTYDKIHGDVRSVIYGGTVEKQFSQCDTVEGITYVKLYRNAKICGETNHKFPYFVGTDTDRFISTYFDTDYKFVYRNYKQDKSLPMSQDGDEGKLVIRFFEIKQPWQNKDNVRIANYTGDCMYIKFPNGQNMIVDAPLKAVWEDLEKDMDALGIGHIDYFMLTHYHGDHYQCLSNILEKHTIGKFLLPDVCIRHPEVEGVIPEGADVTRVNQYDTMTVGEGDKAVKITFLNPPRYAKRKMTIKNHNPYSLCTVFEFGTSKLMLDADTYDANEKSWMYECPELIADVDVIKPGHHGITTSSRFDFFRKVNPKYVCISNLREYGCHGASTIYMLENLCSFPKENIYTTGMHGMLKATLTGNKGEATVVSEYTEI